MAKIYTLFGTIYYKVLKYFVKILKRPIYSTFA